MALRLFIAIAVLAVAAAPARGQARGGGAPAGGALAGASPEVRTALYQIANAHGMLRGVNEVDAITSQLFEGTGTMYVDGKGEYRITKYKAEVNYFYPGLRIDIERTGAGGSERVIPVVSGMHAWNEVNMPGGPATADMAALRARLLEVWTMPHGVLKAARKAPDKVTLAMESGGRVLTIPLPAPLSGTMKATVDTRGHVARVIATVQEGGRQTIVEAAYDDYKDPDMSDIVFPHHIVRTSGSRTLLDLTVTKATMYNPYVIMPVPENVEKLAATSR